MTGTETFIAILLVTVIVGGVFLICWLSQGARTQSDRIRQIVKEEIKRNAG